MSDCTLCRPDFKGLKSSLNVVNDKMELCQAVHCVGAGTLQCTTAYT